MLSYGALERTKNPQIESTVKPSGKSKDHLETSYGLSKYVLNYIHIATPSLTN